MFYIILSSSDFFPSCWTSSVNFNIISIKFEKQMFNHNQSSLFQSLCEEFKNRHWVCKCRSIENKSASLFHWFALVLFVHIWTILSFDMTEIQEVQDTSDESETDSFIEQIYHTRTDTKLQRIVKTFLINFSFIALVSEQIL